MVFKGRWSRLDGEESVEVKTVLSIALDLSCVGGEGKTNG